MFLSKGWSTVLKPDLENQRLALAKRLIYSSLGTDDDANLRAGIRAIDRIFQIERELFESRPAEQEEQPAVPPTGSRYDL